MDSTFELFMDLGASDELCEFPVVYASGVCTSWDLAKLQKLRGGRIYSNLTEQVEVGRGGLMERKLLERVTERWQNLFH